MGVLAVLPVWLLSLLLLVEPSASGLVEIDLPDNKLLSPHLIQSEGGVQKVLDSDIATFYGTASSSSSSSDCNFDLQLLFLFGDATKRLLPHFVKGPISTLAYNEIIVLLSLIEEHRLTGSLCESRLLNDVSSHDFCSDFQTERLLESDHATLLKALGYQNLVPLVQKLSEIESEAECREKYHLGDKYSSVLCKAVTSLLAFFVKQNIRIPPCKSV